VILATLFRFPRRRPSSTACDPGLCYVIAGARPTQGPMVARAGAPPTPAAPTRHRPGVSPSPRATPQAPPLPMAAATPRRTAHPTQTPTPAAPPPTPQPPSTEDSMPEFFGAPPVEQQAIVPNAPSPPVKGGTKRQQFGDMLARRVLARHGSADEAG